LHRLTEARSHEIERPKAWRIDVREVRGEHVVTSQVVVEAAPQLLHMIEHSFDAHARPSSRDVP